MQVDYENLDLARQVLERQGQQHLPAMRDHLNTWARLETGDLGLILQVFKPANDALVDLGERVLSTAQDIYDQGASNLDLVINTYADADKEAHTLLEDLAATLGFPVSSFQDPREDLSTLGAAKKDAGPYYRAGDPDLFTQAAQDGYRLGDWTTDDVAGRATTRREEMSGTSASVAEEEDVQSYLITPTGSAGEIENLRWEAGLILGSLDWVFEKLFGFSLLNELVYKPFAGDWNRVQAASGAWKIAGDATKAVSMNTTGILPGVSEWTGKGSEAFAAAAASVAALGNSVAGVAGTISMVIKGFAFLVKQVSKFIGKQLKRISYKLARMAAEAAVPVVGWAAMVIEMAETVTSVWEDFKSAYTMVNRIYDFVSRLIAAKGAVVDTYHQASQVLEALARGAVARA